MSPKESWGVLFFVLFCFSLHRKVTGSEIKIVFNCYKLKCTHFLMYLGEREKSVVHVMDRSTMKVWFIKVFY